MTKKEITTLIGVIAKIKEISDRDYDSKLYDNILAIFNRLNTREKRTLLKGLINICFIVEDKVLVSSADLEEVKDAILTTKETILTSKDTIASVEEGNRVELTNELIKLKIMFVKALLIVLVTILATFLITKFNISLDLTSSFMEGIGKMIKVMFF